MVQKKLTVFKMLMASIFLIMPLYSKEKENKKTLLTWENIQLSRKVKQSLLDQTYSFGEVTTLKKENKQKLNLTVAGLHPKKCAIALSKISQYESYSEFINFVKTSHYNEKTKIIKLKFDHMLMPFPMYLHFEIDRIDKIGNYTFSFHQGFLTGLTGLIQVGEYKSRCLFYFNAKWMGQESKIPDSVFSFFLDVLGQRLLDNLFRVSRTL